MATILQGTQLELIPEPLTTKMMEWKLAHFFDYRVNLIVPRVSWGFDIHECDLLIMSKSGYATEVEIKISKADLIKDKDKPHMHLDNRLKALYFAIPEKLKDCIEHIPERAGVILVNNDVHVNPYRPACNIFREPKINKTPHKFTIEEQFKLARLGTMRIW